MKSSVHLYIVLIFTGLSIAVSGTAKPLHFVAEDGDSRNMAMFESNAPLEKVVGRTHDLQATLTVDPADLSENITGKFTVNLQSLDTGLQLRNQHMRENHLETDKFPDAVFEITEITTDETALTPETPVAVTVMGDLTLHGVTMSYAVPGEITYWTIGSDKLLSGKAKWEIDLQDHRINRPRYLFMKLAETQIASISFVLKAK